MEFQKRSLKVSSKTETLGDALPKEIERCEELLENYKEIGVAGNFVSAQLSSLLFQAKKAIAEGNTVEQLKLYRELEGYE